MHIQKIEVKNFRLLKEVEILLEKKTTLIVGRNNSGKTSFIELIRRCSEINSPKFQLIDFSIPIHDNFWQGFKLKNQGEQEKNIREILPFIEVKISIEYEKEATNLGPLSNFIIDLDPNCTEVLIIIRYQVKDGGIEQFYNGIELNPEDDENQRRIELLNVLNKEGRIKDCYTTNIYSEDPNDPTNQKQMKWTQFYSLIKYCFIFAQRGLDDITYKNINLLGNIFEKLLMASIDDTEDTENKKATQELEIAIKSMEKNIDESFKKTLMKILPNFSEFGYPGLTDPKLITETILDTERLMKDHTRVCYYGENNINLPESYNGLGVRNLIYILLKLYEFSKSLKTEQISPSVCLFIIEEPEVHLHPQMQEVFIRKLDDFVAFFGEEYKDSIQYIVTTHSSHIANAAVFNSVRYFLPKHQGDELGYCKTVIKDLNKGLGKTVKKDREFLHKYMTLTRCDLLFADKVILIEGASERLMLPEMIRKEDEEQTDSNLKLSSQYISVIEVGGAYFHIFFDLLHFLELYTLIITDLDSVKGNGKKKKCKVSEGTHTSNAGIKQWFNSKEITPYDLIQKTEAEKIKKYCRLVYQIPDIEGDPCGRSFEDAFILANLDLFSIKEPSSEEKENKVYEMAEKKKNKKVDFALEHAIYNTDWNVPKYIAEGLQWLAKKNLHNNSVTVEQPKELLNNDDNNLKEDE